MNEILWYVYTSIMGIVLALGCAYIITKVNDTIQKINNNIKVRRKRHELLCRFDKPPRAKCYCMDCLHRSGEGRCDLADCYVDQEFFCKHANPREGRMKVDEYKA